MIIGEQQRNAFANQVFRVTEATAYQMGRDCRAIGYALTSNTFSKVAWDNVVRNVGRSLAPKYPEWARWAAMWSKGWLDENAARETAR